MGMRRILILAALAAGVVGIGPPAASTAAGVGMNKHLHGVIIEDQLKPPSAGHGLVRVIQAASRAPKADVTAQNGLVLAKSAAFASTSRYATVPAGSLHVDAKAEG